MREGDTVWAGTFDNAFEASVFFVEGDMDDGGHSYKLMLHVTCGHIIIGNEEISLHGYPLHYPGRMDELIGRWRARVEYLVHLYRKWSDEKRFDEKDS